MTHEEWLAHKTVAIRAGQRQRRVKLRRIDYQDVSAEAAAIIDAQRRPFVGGDYSSILNRIVVEWAARQK